MQIAPDGVIGTNCMVAVTDYAALVKASCEGGAKLIVSGAGLPMNLPELTAEWPDVALVPIVSSVKAAELIARKWHKAYDRLPDAVVVEDPDTAGGHLGEKLENIGTGEYDQYATVRGVKDYFRDNGISISRLSLPAVSGTTKIFSMPWSRAPMACRWALALSAPKSVMLMMHLNRLIWIVARKISACS